MRVNRFGIGVRIAGYDVAPWVIEGGSIEYGRSTVNEQPGAPTCHLTLFTQEGWPQNTDAWFEFGVGEFSTVSGFAPDHDTQDEYIGPRLPLFIGAPVWVSATTTSGFLPDHDTQDTYLGAEFRRFTGKVQSIEYSRYRVDVVCAGDMEKWARAAIFTPDSFIGDAEGGNLEVRDEVRAAALPAAAQTVLEYLHVEGVDGTGVLMMPIPDDAYPLCLLVELQNLADDADALLYQDREGRVIYRHRSWEPPDHYTLPATVVNADAIDMVLELGDMANNIIVEYGVTDPDTGRLHTVATDEPSMDLYGVRTAYYTPPIADVESAGAHAYDIINRIRVAWHMPDIELVMELATDAQVAEIMALDQGYPVYVPNLPPGSPNYGNAYDALILGWTEDLSSNDWVVTMHLHPWYYRNPVSG